MNDIESLELKCSNYLTSSEISSTQSKLLFKFRTRMYSVKANFRSRYENNLLCNLCASSECNQSHLFVCPVLKAFIPELFVTTTKYEDIFGDLDQMKKAVVLIEKICNIREQLLEDIQ